MAIPCGSGAYNSRRVTLRPRRVTRQYAPAPCNCSSAVSHAARRALYPHVPGTYRSLCKLSFLWLKPTSPTAADRQNSTRNERHWSTSRYKRCFHSNLFQLCCYPLTVHLKNSMYKVLHNQDIKHECSRSGGLHAYPDHFREPKKLYL